MATTKTAMDVGSHEDHLVALLRSDPPWPSGTIVELLETTPSMRVRNAAAIALVDRRATETTDRIAAVLANSCIAPQAGTLVFALDELGGTLPLAGLINLIRHGSYEARAEALLLVEEGRLGPCDRHGCERALSELAEIANGADSEAADAAREAMNELARPSTRLAPSKDTE